MCTQKSLRTNHPRHWHVGIIFLLLVFAIPQSRASDAVYSHEEGAPAREPFGAGSAARAVRSEREREDRFPTPLRLRMSSKKAKSLLPCALAVDDIPSDEAYFGMLLLFSNHVFHAAIVSLGRGSHYCSPTTIIHQIYQAACFEGSHLIDLTQVQALGVAHYRVEVPFGYRVAFALLRRRPPIRVRCPGAARDEVGRVFPGGSEVIAGKITPVLRSGCRGYRRGKYRLYKGLGCKVTHHEDDDSSS